MTRKQGNAKRTNWKELAAEQEGFLRALVQEIVQQLLQVEMDEALGVEKGNGRRTVRATDPGTTGGRW
jgi:transposase-like protein